MKEICNIVVAPNNKYLPYMTVLLVSLFETNPEKEFQIYALYHTLDTDAVEMVKTMVA